MEFPSEETYIGWSDTYDNFNDWSFASQLYQAMVTKYHIEFNRENKYHPTGAALQYMVNEWWPSVNFGFTDWNLEPKISFFWIKQAFGPQLVATRVNRNIYSQGEKIELPIHLMNDSYIEFKAAKVDWRIVEETDSFFIKGHAKPYIENRHPPSPLTVTIGHQIPVAEAAKGQFTVDLPADSHVIAGTLNFNAPKTAQPKHYSIYMTLVSAEGKTLCENFDHFVVVKNARTFRTPEGISPRPRFNLNLKLVKDGKPLAEAGVKIVDKYNPAQKYETRLNADGAGTITSMLPGAYRLAAEGNTFEFLLNKDETLEVNFAPGLKTTLGTKPIIDWPQMPEPVNAHIEK